MCGRLDNLSSQNDVSQGDVNEIINSLNDIYLSNCRSSFGTISPKNQTGQTKNDSWFTKDCKTARKHFHSAKHQYKLRKNYENKRRLSTCSKHYKKTLHKEQIKYKTKKIKELRKLKTADPRKFWKFLNGNKRSDINLTLDNAHEYFSKISNNQETASDEINFETATLTEND